MSWGRVRPGANLRQKPDVLSSSWINVYYVIVVCIFCLFNLRNFNGILCIIVLWGSAIVVGDLMLSMPPITARAFTVVRLTHRGLYEEEGMLPWGDNKWSWNSAFEHVMANLATLWRGNKSRLGLPLNSLLGMPTHLCAYICLFECLKSSYT